MAAIQDKTLCDGSPVGFYSVSLFLWRGAIDQSAVGYKAYTVAMGIMIDNHASPSGLGGYLP